MEIRSEYVELKVSDGTTMQAWTARPTDSGSLPGLLVFQEAFGVNGHIRDITQRFAREGFIAIAPELFHRTGPGFEGATMPSPPSFHTECAERRSDGSRPARRVRMAYRARHCGRPHRRRRLLHGRPRRVPRRADAADRLRYLLLRWRHRSEAATIPACSCAQMISAALFCCFGEAKTRALPMTRFAPSAIPSVTPGRTSSAWKSRTPNMVSSAISAHRTTPTRRPKPGR